MKPLWWKWSFFLLQKMLINLFIDHVSWIMCFVLFSSCGSLWPKSTWQTKAWTGKKPRELVLMSGATQMMTNWVFKLSEWVICQNFCFYIAKYVQYITNTYYIRCSGFGISKVIRVFEFPLLCIWQYECSVHIFRSPWTS